MMKVNDNSSHMTENQKRSVLISGHRTSISLEEAFWTKLKEISKRNGKSMNQQITEIDNERFKSSKKNLSSAIRVYVLKKINQTSDNIIKND
jgi:predicted DNA-binding ribbon-helix-helix protein